MTPEERAFLAAIKQRLAERGALLLATEAGVIDQLKAARTLILEQLAAQPGDFAQWRLPQLLEQIEAVLAGALGRAAGVADQGLRAAWQQGEDFVDKPLAAGGLNVEIQLPVLDATVLQQMRAFAAMRFKDVATEAATKISRQLGLVTLGAQTPFEAVKQIQTLLGSESPRRATTIVRTEVSRAFALASDQRLAQAAKVVPGLGKQWRRSGKIHSRWTHDLMDGQVVDAGKPFKVPSMEGGFDLMQHPHDPTAPADQNINCGCIALPYRASWAVAAPGAKPFTAQELKLDGRKAALDQAAKRAGRRTEGAGPAPSNGAYDLAKAGGTHFGWYLDRSADGPVQLAKSLRNIENLMVKHQGWIADPASKVADWAERDARYQAGLLAKWQKDIKRQAEHVDILKGLLREKKGSNNGTT